ncbi:thiamine phosphate synthase [Jiella avicenniae]|uniref:Thiamine phosphate synthase n=1 Tax=Jiella avicenniae TaxID=2907202 RepID=A0A9X1P1G1_9HYPH|nr:thiamine phosphate synthase [Jiella avicenniae]MCE7028336.1 thiamine phosphate synthase [Jiella avicenniae]
MISDPIRPRLVLVTTPLTDADAETKTRAALAGGDVASVLIDPAGRDAAAFQAFAERLVPLIQAAGAAAIVVDDTRAAGRAKADGLHLSDGDLEALGEAVSRHQPRLIVGASGFETRHEALEAGERMPDYLMFGRFGGDAEAAPHPKSLALAEWWAEIVEIPCILLGGSDLATLDAAAETGAEFVALSRAVFGAEADPEAAVRTANATFDAFFERISQ